MWRKFYDAVVVAYNEMVCGASVKRAIEHVIKNEAWVNAASFLKDSRTGVILTTSAINKALQRWLDKGQYSGFEEIGELPKAFKKGKESREKLRRYYEVLKGLNKSEPSAAS